MIKTLISLSVEKTFLEMGIPELEFIMSRLQEDYNCKLSDCLEHPEYLKKIILELFGDSYQDIIKSIHKNLQETDMEQPILNFINTLNYEYPQK